MRWFSVPTTIRRPSNAAYLVLPVGRCHPGSPVCASSALIALSPPYCRVSRCPAAVRMPGPRGISVERRHRSLPVAAARTTIASPSVVSAPKKTLSPTAAIGTSELPSLVTVLYSHLRLPDARSRARRERDPSPRGPYSVTGSKTCPLLTTGGAAYSSCPSEYRHRSCRSP